MSVHRRAWLQAQSRQPPAASRQPPAVGFTLVEMLVSLGIFAVITAFVMANFRAGSQGDELRISSQLIASEIRHVQSMAVAGETVLLCKVGPAFVKACPGGAADCAGGTCVQDIPAGYGIHFSATAPDNRKAVVFADTDGNGRYDPGEALRSDSVTPGAFVSVTAVSPAGNALDIVFSPPKPSVAFNGGSPDVVATITVKHQTTGDTKTVSMNRISGQISAE